MLIKLVVIGGFWGDERRERDWVKVGVLSWICLGSVSFLWFFVAESEARK